VQSGHHVEDRDAGPERLAVLKRAAVSAAWELAGGATSMAELVEQVDLWTPDVVVVEGVLGSDVVAAVRAACPFARIVSLGAVEGADAVAGSEEDIRPAIMGVRKPGGPVRA